MVGTSRDHDLAEKLVLICEMAVDCPTGRPLRLASDLALAPIDVSSLYATGRKGGIVSFNGGGSCFIVGGQFTLTGSHARILLARLPPIVHLQTDSD
jgi:Cupin